MTYSTPTNPSGERTLRPRAVAAALACACVAALAPAAANATKLSDPAGDILPTFTTFPGDPSDHSDLDVISVSASRHGSSVFLSATMNGDIGQTLDGLYVWGVDRGQGIDFLADLNPSVGKGVDFDTFIVLDQLGNATVNNVTFNPDRSINKIDSLGLDPGSVVIDGARIQVTVPFADLPTTGFDPTAYRYNIWPRFQKIPDTTAVSDFAPDGSTFLASVPEPLTWTMMIGGFGMAGGMLRRRRALAV